MNWELIETYALRVSSVVLFILLVAALAPARVHRAALRPVRAIVDVQFGEMRPMFLSALFFFFTLAAYFILRPIRDAMAVASGARDLPLFFLWTLSAMLVANPLYSALVSKFPVKRFVGYAYAFFGVCLLAFYLLWEGQIAVVLTGRAFFAFTTVMSVFATSIFWGVMADRFSSGQAKRLFGFIGIGGTLGSITGLSLTAFLSSRIGVPNMILISALCIAIAIVIVTTLPAAVVPGESVAAVTAKKDAEIIGGSFLDGILHVLKSPYLAAIAAFLFLYVFGSTILYVAQTDVLGRFFSDNAVVRTVLARVELVTQIIAALGQAFITARAIRIGGLQVTLSAVPFVSVIGFAALGLATMGVLPLLATFIVFSVVRRSSEFMLTNPSRKVLFTVLSREDKFKATTFLETFVYRFGDQLSIWANAGLIAVGLTLTGISWISALMAIPYLTLAVWLARRQGQMAAAGDTLPRAHAQPAIARAIP